MASERSLRRPVVQETGLTYGQWRQPLRLLLTIRTPAGGENVQQVSGMSGYASVTAFITTFKKASGTAPSRYVTQR
ncbi:helix-turn-helix domain-containing protein [Novosphingobium sp. YAF33]|uniref:helix-turn-helix domain-containing protein n=1 Tax=Novosphingobium sp. YAF33 TaxID=3233082 RepID=UPI003F992085